MRGLRMAGMVQGKVAKQALKRSTAYAIRAAKPTIQGMAGGENENEGEMLEGQRLLTD